MLTCIQQWRQGGNNNKLAQKISDSGCYNGLVQTECISHKSSLSRELFLQEYKCRPLWGCVDAFDNKICHVFQKKLFRTFYLVYSLFFRYKSKFTDILSTKLKSWKYDSLQKLRRFFDFLRDISPVIEWAYFFPKIFPYLCVALSEDCCNSIKLWLLFKIKRRWEKFWMT